MFRSSCFFPTLEPPQPWWQSSGGHVPLAVLLALLLCSVPAHLRLSRGLSADLQRGADLAPTAALVACCQDQEPDRLVDVLLGVSRGPQVAQGPLWTSSGLVQVLDGSGQQPPGVGAGFGAHVNRGCHRFGVSVAEWSTTSMTPIRLLTRASKRNLEGLLSARLSGTPS